MSKQKDWKSREDRFLEWIDKVSPLTRLALEITTGVGVFVGFMLFGLEWPQCAVVAFAVGTVAGVWRLCLLPRDLRTWWREFRNRPRHVSVRDYFRAGSVGDRMLPVSTSVSEER